MSKASPLHQRDFAAGTAIDNIGKSQEQQLVGTFAVSSMGLTGDVTDGPPEPPVQTRHMRRDASGLAPCQWIVS